MSKAVKPEEIKSEPEVVISDSNSVIKTEGDTSITQNNEPIYVPDTPAQMTEAQEQSVKIVNETEVEFLQRILNHQHTGGFGRHLDEMINERIKSLS